MKRIFCFTISLLLLLTGCRSIKPAAGSGTSSDTAAGTVKENISGKPDYSDPKTFLLGYFDRERLLQEPYSAWYLQGIEDYQFNTDALNTLMDRDKTGISIKIVMGTWCSDSRREVPRFMRVLDIWQFPLTEVTFIGVDEAKLSPVSDFDKLDIRKVPTIIIYKNNIEAGRIIEIPVASLEQDMVNILGRNE